MTFPTVTEITPRPEPATPDPFIDGLAALGRDAPAALDRDVHAADVLRIRLT